MKVLGTKLHFLFLCGGPYYNFINWGVLTTNYITSHIIHEVIRVSSEITLRASVARDMYNVIIN